MGNTLIFLPRLSTYSVQTKRWAINSIRNVQLIHLVTELLGSVLQYIVTSELITGLNFFPGTCQSLVENVEQMVVLLLAKSHAVVKKTTGNPHQKFIVDYI
jgi:hypothetical protein